MQISRKNQNQFIFLDESGRRWKYLITFSLVLLIVFCIFLFFIIKGLVDKPILNGLHINNHSTYESITQPILNTGKQLSLPSISQNKEESKPEVAAFYQSYNHPNMENKISLRNHIHSINVLIPDWFYLNNTGNIVEKTDSEIDTLAKKNGVEIIPQITLDQNSNADNVHKWLSNPQTKQKMIADMLSVVKNKGYNGIYLHFDSVYWKDKNQFNKFVADLSDSFHSSGLQVAVFVRLGDDTYDSKQLAKVSDHVIINAFDQHIQTGEAGPLASFNWTQHLINQYKGPTEKLIISLANYGYDWNKTSGGPATPLHFPTIMELATRENLKIQWDENSLVPYIRYKEQGKEHIIEFLDASTFYNQVKLAKSYDIPSIGIWNIGSEDPSIWKILSDKVINPSNLETIPNTVSIVDSGSGDYLKVTNVEAEGKRQFETGHNFITKETYESYPTPYHLERYGVDEKKVAITFDGGPSPKDTQQILDILHKYNVKASFFLIGKDASVYPGLVKKIYNEGHEIGNNTFSHVNVLNIKDNELEFELNSTQRVIQGITGHSTALIRPPFLSLNKGGNDLASTKVLDQIVKMQQMGYTIVGASINSGDWEKKSAEDIFNEVKKNVQNGKAIHLTDAGKDQSPMIEALPKIIEWLQEEGYSIVPTSELVGKNRSDVMPAVKANEESITPFYSFGTSMSSLIFKGITILMYSLIVLGIIRLVVLFYYSLKQKRNSRHREYDDSYRPFVSIIIAAYNEEKVIGHTIQSIMHNNYPNFELIIVDDGSTDQTAGVIEQERRKYPNIRLIRKRNGGKSSALNLGFKEAQAEIIVTLDADTLIAGNTVSSMVRHFTDPNVAAVSGNVKVGNRKNWLTLWQHMEYVSGFNLEKRAFDELNCIPVVPGAIGAWRKTAVAEAGFFEEDTLAEDTDLTLKLLRKGYRVRSEVEGVAFTEAPENVKSFVKQRYRWTYGILQCIWKHKGALFDKRNKGLGFIAMPNMIFNYVLFMTAFLADILLVMGFISKNPIVLYYYLAFLFFDTVVAMYSFLLEKESKKPLLTLFIQRLVYVQFFSFVVWKSIIFALKGRLMGWNKLQRTGNVQHQLLK